MLTPASNYARRGPRDGGTRRGQGPGLKPLPCVCLFRGAEAHAPSEEQRQRQERRNPTHRDETAMNGAPGRLIQSNNRTEPSRSRIAVSTHSISLRATSISWSRSVLQGISCSSVQNSFPIPWATTNDRSPSTRERSWFRTTMAVCRVFCG